MEYNENGDSEYVQSYIRKLRGVDSFAASFNATMDKVCRTQPVEWSKTYIGFRSKGNIEMPMGATESKDILTNELLLSCYIYTFVKHHNAVINQLLLNAADPVEHHVPAVTTIPPGYLREMIKSEVGKRLVHTYTDKTDSYKYEHWVSQGLRAFQNYMKRNPFVSKIDTALNVYLELCTYVRFSPTAKAVVQQDLYFQPTESMLYNCQFDRIVIN